LRRKRRVVFSIDAARNGEPGMEPPDPSEMTQPGHSLEQEEQERRIQRALARLSPEHRAVLVMKDMEGQKYEVMAEVLQVPIGTIRSRLHRARLELRELLEKDEG
jgi:RNA polymerase sigma-70 factor (ECF subfamily)